MSKYFLLSPLLLSYVNIFIPINFYSKPNCERFCLFDLLLYIHSKQLLRSCRDGLL